MKTRKIASVFWTFVMLLSFMLTSHLTVFANTSYPEGTIIIPLDEQGVPKSTSDTGWEYDSDEEVLTLQKGYSFAVDKTCNVAVTNLGTIVGGTYNKTVNNTGSTKVVNEVGGTIDDGTFYGDVNNYHGWNTCTINDGMFYGTVTLGNHGIINNGTFLGDFKTKLGYTINAATFKIEFVTNGGNWSEDYTVPTTYSYSTSAGIKLPAADDISKIDDITNENLIFYGWYSTEDFSGDVITQIPAKAAGTLTYYARYIGSDATWSLVGEQAVENTDYSIDHNGNYSIFTAKGLAKIANIVNAGDSLEGKTVTLEDHIDLLDGGVDGYSADGVNELNSWIPINGFCGTFDGNGKKISNVYISTKNKDAGFFGSSNGTIKNLEIASGSIEVTSSLSSSVRVGAVAAVNTGIMENCVNQINISVEGEVYAGGITGQTTTSNKNVKISNCKNYGVIGSAKGNSYLGGIVGYQFSGFILNYTVTVENCINEGAISGKWYLGGISGSVINNSSSTTSLVRNCMNNGNVSGDRAGGITGYSKNGYVYNSYNFGTVTGGKYGGGIVGLNQYSMAKAANCYNVGTVSATTNGGAGAVAGMTSYGTVSNCYYLSDSEMAAVGAISNNGTVTECISFTASDSQYLLAESVYETTDLLTALNAWVAAENADNNYLTWIADGNNSNYPAFAKKVNISKEDKSIDYDGNTYDVSQLFSIDANAGEAVYTLTDAGTGEGSLAGTILNINKAGTFVIRVTTAENGEYAMGSMEAILTVLPKNVTATIEKISDQTYTGSAIEPEIKAYDGSTEIPASEYDVEYSENINAGTAVVTLKNKDGGNYIVSGSTTFIIKKADQNAPSGLVGTAETIDGKADGRITGVDNTMEYRKDDAEEYTAVAEGCTELTDLADGTYVIRHKADDNHNASLDTTIVLSNDKKLKVTLPETQTGYTLTVDKTELRWKDDMELTFTLKEGYSKLNTFAVKVTVNGNTITIDDQMGTFEENGKFTLSDVQTDVSVAVEGVVDITAPDAEITLDTNKWNEFFSDITFGLFFKDTQEVTITAEDKGSGVDKIYYYLSAKALTEEEVIALTDSDWTEYKDVVTLAPQDEYIIYAKVTDKVNNTKYISSDKGIVIDSIAPVITGIADGETYYGDTTFGVTEKYVDVVKVDDKPVTFTDGNYTITADGKEHTVVVTDKSGNSSAEIKITVITIASLDDSIEDITTDNVKSSDKEAIEEVQSFVNGLINSGKDFTDAEDAELAGMKATTETLLKKIADTAEEIKVVTDSVNGYDKDTVTSDDKQDIQGLIDRIDALTETENVTETESSALSDVRETAENLLEKIEETGKKLSDLTEQMEALEEDRITLEDEQKIKEWLDEAEELLESELLTDDEKEKLEDSKETAEELLEMIQSFYPSGVERLYGSDRYGTAYKTADALKKALNVEKFECAIITTGKEYADALSGSYLASIKQAPILLTNGKADNVAELIAYIRENVAEGGVIYLLGGENAVTAELDMIEGYQVKRLAGKDRYETNLKILEETGLDDAKELIIVTGKNFADGLSASAAGRPILLVRSGDELKEPQKEIIDQFSTGKIYILGGTSAIDADLEAEVKALAENETNVERIAGKDRYETSVKVAETFFEAPRAVVIAYGKNFPDGLCGGPLAAALNIPLILSSDAYTADAASYINTKNVTSGYVLGGTDVLSEKTVQTVFALEDMIG